MSDIFISYASDDRERIMPLIRALEKTGWSVFWDRTIPTGKHWRLVIGEEIDGCGAMIVVWSKNSMDSKFVMQEAAEGQRREVLFPVVIDNIIPPWGFREEQAQDLTGWDGTEPYPSYDRLVRDITGLLGAAPVTIEEVRRRKEEAEAKRKAAEEERRKKEAEAKRRAAKERRKQKEQIAALYEKAQELVSLQQWKKVQEKMKEIQALDPQFADPKGIVTKAQEELKRKAIQLEQELQERRAAEKQRKQREEAAKRRAREKAAKKEIEHKIEEIEKMALKSPDEIASEGLLGSETRNLSFLLAQRKQREAEAKRKAAEEERRLPEEVTTRKKWADQHPRLMGLIAGFIGASPLLALGLIGDVPQVVIVYPFLAIIMGFSIGSMLKK